MKSSECHLLKDALPGNLCTLLELLRLRRLLGLQRLAPLRHQRISRLHFQLRNADF